MLSMSSLDRSWLPISATGENLNEAGLFMIFMNASRFIRPWLKVLPNPTRACSMPSPARSFGIALEKVLDSFAAAFSGREEILSPKPPMCP
jgi:hypothetical protein